MTTLRLMTYNMLHAPGDRLASLVEVVRGVNPDILACQEVNTFEGMMDLARELNMLPLWGQANSAEDNRNGQPVYEHLVILTRMAPTSVRVHPGDRRAMFRPVLEVRFQPVGSPPLTVFTVHFRAVLDPAERYLKYRELGSFLTVLAEADGAVVALGDFNARAPGESGPQNAAVQIPEDHLAAVQGGVIGAILEASFVDSYRLVHPFQGKPESTLIKWEGSRVDHIFVSPVLEPYVADSYILDNEVARIASDHLPVVTELNFAKLEGTWLSDDAGRAPEEGEVRVID